MLTYERVHEDGRPMRLRVSANEVGIDILAIDDASATFLASVYVEYREGELVLRYWNVEDYDSDPTGVVVLANQPRIKETVRAVKEENRRYTKSEMCACGHPYKDHEKNIDPITGKAYDPPYDTLCTKCGCVGFRRA